MSIPGSIIKKIVGTFIKAFPTLNKLVKMLKFELDIEASYVPNGSDYEDIVFHLVLKLDSDGRIINFIKGACRDNPSNLELQSIQKEIIPIIQLYPILYPLKKDLIEQIKIAYKSCCTEDWLLDEENLFQNLEQVLGKLADMSYRNNDYSPSAQFVAHLILNISSKSPIIDELKEWGKLHVKNFSHLLNKTDIEIKNQQEKQECMSSCFIIKVEPSKQYKERYRISTWFIPNSSNGKFNKSTGEGYLPVTIKELQEQEVFDFEEIRSLLQPLLIQISEQPTFSSYHTTLEFFLPEERLNEEIDAWEIKASEKADPLPIGIDYKISVRSNERLAKSTHKNDWEIKWNLLQQQNEPPCFLVGDGRSKKELISMLRPKNALALKLKKSPSPEIFQVINDAAIPVALWIRQELQNLDIQSELDNLLQCPITELPEQVKAKRLEDFPKDEQTHIGKHISLLWENPNILPPQIKYTLP